MNELEKIAKDLQDGIIKFYEPKSTRWNRNHTEIAEWYFLWSQVEPIIESQSMPQ